MAREEVSLEKLRAMGEKLKKIAERVLEGVAIAERGKLDTPLVHGSAVAKTYLPFINDWSIKLRSDLEIQADAIGEGRKSRMQVDKERAASRKKKK